MSARRAPRRQPEPEPAQLPLFGRPVPMAPRARYVSRELPPSSVFAPPGVTEALVDAGDVTAWRREAADMVGAIRRARSIGEAERARFLGYEWGEDVEAFADAVAASVDGTLTPRGVVDALLSALPHLRASKANRVQRALMRRRGP